MGGELKKVEDVQKSADSPQTNSRNGLYVALVIGVSSIAAAWISTRSHSEDQRPPPVSSGASIVLSQTISPVFNNTNNQLPARLDPPLTPPEPLRVPAAAAAPPPREPKSLPAKPIAPTAATVVAATTTKGAFDCYNAQCVTSGGCNNPAICTNQATAWCYLSWHREGLGDGSWGPPSRKWVCLRTQAQCEDWTSFRPSAGSDVLKRCAELNQYPSLAGTENMTPLTVRQ